ncbi:DUF3425 domain-containing protein [Aspergillus novofumigatus IBT 16806]|uniref:BZIP domain-containing protein n=1 Tax=Aspergillus novofumigatus (strain IBT 16806) TaxID=1392255 RepID=A0A2I1C1E4_ASPN1|nr:uncharacterized protein P174DRAFT_443425 [Aspergillus novofumigatus IBT 16806]PKX91425.1 hypothetical protein P174DRAFT_443425 [Aspergillus novofumigatus IBT 16806]
MMKVILYSTNSRDKRRASLFPKPPGLKTEPSDEWDGIRNPAERRRRQNRVNQRAYRLRNRHRARPVEKTPEIPQSSTVTVSQPHLQELLERFIYAAYGNYIRGSPATDQLLTLTRVNVYRAYLHNITLLGLSPDGLCEADILSPFNQTQPWSTKDSLPPALQPTVIQQSGQHHPWLDFFPHPRARDNLIQAQNNYDEDEFCLDILGFWSHSAPENMLLVWGEPTDPGNWEVTELFIKKWGWVISGCPDILHNTNKWRARRGETPIFRYL